ncbi:YciI family protein [Nocardia mangyaensis]|uniref:YciI family protein n=1 Tax=Nocardia mangyaensis TaxID=2213200 RepID=UPI0026758068|nr:YciI family protein [Nocardia mangyaensis]MDO3649090.1 YciI family protein [Nocardia mangyaensis]
MPIFAVHYTYTDATAVDRANHRPEHRAWLNALVDTAVLPAGPEAVAERDHAGASGTATVLSSGPYPDGTGALLLFRAENATALTDLLGHDPFAEKNLIEAVRVVEWLPVMGAFA